jgi:hypothetical protein
MLDPAMLDPAMLDPAMLDPAMSEGKLFVSFRRIGKHQISLPRFEHRP